MIMQLCFSHYIFVAKIFACHFQPKKKNGFTLHPSL